MELMQELAVAKRLAIDAGEKILEIYEKENIEVEQKDEDGHISPLTEADTEANEIIVNGLHEAFPDYGILTEEKSSVADRAGKTKVFIVDPLDGTKEFIKKNGEFTVNIGMCIDQQIVMGVIYVPVRDELYYAVLGQGAYAVVNGKTGKLKVTSSNMPELMRCVVSRSHPSGKLQRLLSEITFKETVPSGSSLKGCLVAIGEADVYPRLGPQNEWDFAAMNMIVTEAGGKMTDLSGKEILYNKATTLIDGYLVTNGTTIHDTILEKVKAFE